MITADQIAAVVEPRLPCPHDPPCPSYSAPDHDAARTVADHHDQGWILLCNGVVVFEDEGEIWPNGVTVPAHMNDAPHRIGGAR